MTTLKLKNRELAPAINLLASLDFKNKKSRNRTKLVNLLTPPLKEFQTELDKLSDEFSLKDSDGTAIPADNGQGGNKVIPSKAKEYKKQLEELQDEVVTIEGGTYVSNIDALYQDLVKLDKVLSGADAQAYDRLLDEYETNDNFKGDK